MINHMEPILIIGIIIFTGFAGGELCAHFGLSKVTGYILAGLILNPDLTHLIHKSFVTHTTLVINIALSFITFSVGGTLSLPVFALKKAGEITFKKICEK